MCLAYIRIFFFSTTQIKKNIWCKVEWEATRKKTLIICYKYMLVFDSQTASINKLMYGGPQNLLLLQVSGWLYPLLIVLQKSTKNRRLLGIYFLMMFFTTDCWEFFIFIHGLIEKNSYLEYKLYTEWKLEL